MLLARERSETFAGSNSHAMPMVNISANICKGLAAENGESWRTVCPQRYYVTTREMWAQLRDDVMRYGIYNRISRRCRQPVPSLISTMLRRYSSDCGESRDTQRGQNRTRFYPAPFMTNENLALYQDAYETAQKRSSTPTRKRLAMSIRGVADAVFPRYRHHSRYQQSADYAWRKGIKTLYYIRLRQMARKALKLKAASRVHFKEYL